MRPSDKIVRRLVVFGIVAALAVGALALPALAQSATEDGSETSSEEATSPQERFEDRQSAFAEALADELGLPMDQVSEAITAARERLASEWREQRTARLRERLDAAVADGQLTQEQADAILEAAEAGVLPDAPLGPGRALGRHGFGLHGGPGEMHLWFDTPDDVTPEASATDTSA
jgi:hypothetical protein